MASTIEALGLIVLTVLPGAVLVFSYERHAGPLAGDANDRAIRFVVATVLVFPYTAALAAFAFSRILHVPGAGETEFRNRLEHPTSISPAWTLLPLAYVLLPWFIGWAGGRLRVNRRKQAVEARSTSLVPGIGAWDIVFLEPGPKLISAKLREGPWIGGLFAGDSFASAPAAKHKELVLEARVQVTPDGEIERDRDGVPLQRVGAIVLNYSDVELLIVEPA